MEQASSLPLLTVPDTGAKQQILTLGAEHLNKCYQCGTCSVVCPLTPDTSAFPRKEMAWAQWGLSDKLASDGDAWLCHQCNECNTHCPRGAMPGDLMAAVRHFQIEHYSFPKMAVQGYQRAEDAAPSPGPSHHTDGPAAGIRGPAPQRRAGIS